MSAIDMGRLKADASGNTGLSTTLAEAVQGFSSTEDAVRFLASRGFAITPDDLAAAAPEEGAASGETKGEAGEDGYGALIRFMRRG